MTAGNMFREWARTWFNAAGFTWAQTCYPALWNIWKPWDAKINKSCDPFLISELCNTAVAARVSTAWRNEKSPERAFRTWCSSASCGWNEYYGNKTDILTNKTFTDGHKLFHLFSRLEKQNKKSEKCLTWISFCLASQGFHTGLSEGWNNLAGSL